MAGSALRCLRSVGMILRYSILALTVAGALIASAAADKNDKREDVPTMIERAKEHYDFRVDGAPSFRLKVAFKIAQENGSTADGTYSEVWVSRRQWRRETVLGDFRRTEVAAGRKKWTLDSAADVPDHLADTISLLQADRFKMVGWKKAKIKDRTVDRRMLRCLEVRSEGVMALCFEIGSGVLAAEVMPLTLTDRIVEKTCVFSDYQPMGDRTIAKSYQCFEGDKARLEAKVTELEIGNNNIDLSLFNPPDGGKKTTNCLSDVSSPVLVHQENPRPPTGFYGHSLVRLSLVVGVDGKPRNVKVTSQPNALAQDAMDAVQKWTFKPAACEGEPMETEITVEVLFSGP